MSTVTYLFGNVDERGKLDQSDIAQDLKETLKTVENSAEYLEKILSDTIELPAADKKSNEPAGSVKPAADAVDYSDTQELAEDLAPLPKPLEPQLVIQPQPMQMPAVVPTKTLADYFPTFVPGARLKFSELFASKVPKSYHILRIDPLKQSVRDSSYVMAQQDEEVFMTPLPARYEEKVEQVEEMVVEEEEEEEKKEKPLLPFVETIATNEFDPVVLEEWEDKIVWDVAQGDKRSNDFIPTFNKTTMFRNTHLELDDWMDAIVWDAEKEYQPVNFHMDDPKLVILQDEVDDIVNPKPESMRVSMYKKRPDGKVIDRFNISDDWLYEIVKTKISRMRHAFGPATLVHSLPATMLHTQYFKPLLHVRELRSHHRPSVKFPLKEWYTFSRVKQIKKKKLKEIDPAELMKSPKDVSLKDTAKFCLVEYSEEYPPIMQNTGMASLIYNYYRKKDEKDSFVPKLANGGPIILESVDASPFFGYGDVKPGQTIQVIFNNLFRAPIFEQNKSQTDFLLIRQTYRGETKYYLRDIPNTYIVGQTYPVQEVPRPQARKITQSLKNRLQVVAFRLMRDDTYKRLRYDKLRKMFPMFNDMQIRQKLKEFAQYLKKGENTGWWKLKPNVQLPDEEGIRKIITPEQVCLIQSTLVGQQRLKDAGYAAEDYKENENEEDESHLDIEVQLAPWTTTRNFVTAASGKGMCRLFGPGDPTGCGEGFSFIRASMKEMFFRYGESEEKQKQFIEEKTKATYHKYSIAEQQVVYKSEVERIWNNQLRGLSAKTVDEKDRELDSARHEKQRREKEEEKDRQRNMGGSLAPYSPPNVQNDTYSDDEQENYTQKNKMLVITRLQKNSNGEMEWVSEVIYDMRVINAYTRYRKLIEQAAEEGEDPSEENRPNLIKQRTKSHIIKLQLKQGKKPTIEGAEEYGDLSMIDGDIKPLPVVIKIPQNTQPPSKKKRAQDDYDDYPTELMKTSNRRRTSPLIDLISIFEKSVADVIANPEAWVFCHPVSQHQFPDYYTLVKKPITLEKIRENCRNYVYRTLAQFMEDVQLLYDNCFTYNGPMHHLTQQVKGYVAQIKIDMDTQSQEISRLEAEIKEEGKPQDESEPMQVDTLVQGNS